MTTRTRFPWVLTGALVSGAVLVAIAGTCLLASGAVAVVALRQKAQAAQAVAPTDIIYEQDVEYGKGGGQRLLLDIARPKEGEGPFPAVVCIHGGGWRGGDKTSFRAFTQIMARKGYVAVTIKYRFAPAHPFPAQIEDVKTAVRYLRANAKEFKLDTDRIGAMGGSAGGHLALLLGTTDEKDGLEGSGGHAGHSTRVQAVASLAGPVDLAKPYPKAVEQMLKDLVGGDKAKDTKSFEKASPTTYLTSDDPPVLAIHGTKDELVPYEQATLLIDACKKAGVDAELITITNGGHGYGGNAKDWLSANEKMIEFFDKHLKRK